ncbi:unnamed protein product [Peronospora effusa]|uniref:Amine oxidase domain-containing protein n=1 Tax=Peronospora farinosa TaxID=134698 RepID=A0AAV0TG06_9STRA|nr:unnamed protein product [Peronospora farinosa]CAI5708841.1 unnamed protein product [Peronospora effusa]CAI5718665.1 unnamed protein product [Peronospora farinosa]
MKIIVVGSGIGGISAAYHLVKDGHEVVLLEKNATIGGHAYEMKIDGEMVDIGFMMFGDSNPNIKEWFKMLGVTQPDVCSTSSTFASGACSSTFTNSQWIS